MDLSQKKKKKKKKKKVECNIKVECHSLSIKISDGCSSLDDIREHRKVTWKKIKRMYE